MAYKFFVISSNVSNSALDLDEMMYNSESASKSFEIGKAEQGKNQIASASSALIIGGILGLIQAAFLILAAKPLLSFMGVKSVSDRRKQKHYDFSIATLNCISQQYEVDGTV